MLLFCRPLESKPARERRRRQNEEIRSLERLVKSEQQLSMTSQQHVSPGFEPKDLVKNRMIDNLVKQAQVVSNSSRVCQFTLSVE